MKCIKSLEKNKYNEKIRVRLEIIFNKFSEIYIKRSIFIFIL